MKQVEPLPVWPSGEGWTVAILRASPATIAKKWNILFSEGLDGLGPFKLAALEEPAVGQIWLFAHLNVPMRGTEVVVDAAVSRDDALAALWREMRVDVRSFSWLTHHAIHPAREAQRGGETVDEPEAFVQPSDTAAAELHHLVEATHSLVDEALHLLGAGEPDTCSTCGAAECTCTPSRAAVRSDLERARAAMYRAAELTRR